MFFRNHSLKECTVVLYGIFIAVAGTMKPFTGHAQQSIAMTDTLRISLDSAEQIFLRNNLQLLAQKYQVDVQKALVAQAKLFPNPNVQFSTLVYNTDTKEVFPFGNTGEITGQLQQLIQLAGKRNKAIKMAQANVKLSEYQFFDLLRTLNYTLRTDFFQIHYWMQSAKVYDDEIASLQTVVAAYNEVKNKGYISEKEMIRVQALLYSLQSEYNDLNNQIQDVESELRQVLQVQHVFVLPSVNEQAVAALNPVAYSLNNLIDSAYQNRTDLQIAKANADIDHLNLAYQKSLGVPDLTLFGTYDQQAAYPNNAVSLGVGIDLPFFNRNQGNIKSAKWQIKSSEAYQKSVEATVEENVYRALQKALGQDKLYKSMDAQFQSDFTRLQQEVLSNYKKRNMSLLDFLDFYDSYKQNVLQQNNILFNRVSAFEDINYYTGTNFFN